MLDVLSECLEVEFPDLTPLPTSTWHDLELCSCDIDILSISHDDLTLRINRLRCSCPGNGNGRKVVEIIVELCLEADITPIAIDVVPDAEEFWEVMGFVPLMDGSRDWIHESRVQYH